jgi:hypothetical protein
MIEGLREAATFVWGRPFKGFRPAPQRAPYAIGQILRTLKPSYRAVATAIPSLRCLRACLVVWCSMRSGTTAEDPRRNSDGNACQTSSASVEP